MQDNYPIRRFFCRARRYRVTSTRISQISEILYENTTSRRNMRYSSKPDNGVVIKVFRRAADVRQIANPKKSYRTRLKIHILHFPGQCKRSNSRFRTMKLDILDASGNQLTDSKTKRPEPAETRKIEFSILFGKTSQNTSKSMSLKPSSWTILVHFLDKYSKFEFCVFCNFQPLHEHPISPKSRYCKNSTKHV